MQLDPHSDTLAAIRLGLLALLTVGLLGTGAELLLMGHVDGVSQLVPVALLPVAVLVVGWHVAERGRRSVRTLQATMLAFLASGALGVVLHYRGNVEFALERDPGLTGLSLVREALTGATPALAPGTMCMLGLMGFAYAFRHPALAGRRRAPSPTPPSPPRPAP